MAQIRRSISWAAYPFVVLTSFLFSMIHLAPPAWTKTHGATDVPLGGFSGPELTGLIGELCENELFDHRLSEEHRRLQSGTLDLAQVAPESIQNTAGMTALPPAPYRGPAAPETKLNTPGMTALPPAPYLGPAAPETKLRTIWTTPLPPAPYLGPAAPETMELVPLDELVPTPDVLLQQTPKVRTLQAPSADLGGGADPLQGGSDTLDPGLGIDTAPPQQTPGVKIQRVPSVQSQQIQNQPVTTQPIPKGLINRTK